MAKREPFDHRLNLKPVPVFHADGRQTTGTAEGNNAAWNCTCGALLVGRCYYQFGDVCHTPCERCGRTFRVVGDDKKRAIKVVEQQLRSAAA